MRLLRRPVSRGFTFLELMIVIAIIAILAAIIVPNYIHVKERQKLDTCENNIHMLQVALGSYAAENDMHPATNTLNASLVTGYIEAIPLCPAEDAGTAPDERYGYEAENGANLNPAEDNYTLYCKGGPHHAGTGIAGLAGADVPGYSTKAAPPYYPRDAWSQIQP